MTKPGLALDVLVRDRMMSFQELADEAFRDLLNKHHRPADLKSALKQSARIDAGIHTWYPEVGEKSDRGTAHRSSVATRREQIGPDA